MGDARPWDATKEGIKSYCVLGVMNVDKYIPLLHNIISSTNKTIATAATVTDTQLAHVRLSNNRHKVCIKYNNYEIAYIVFYVTPIKLDGVVVSWVLTVSAAETRDAYRKRRYFLWLHNTVFFFATLLANKRRIVEMHYKIHNGAVLHTLLKYYQPAVIRSERTAEVVDDRETIADYQSAADDIGLLERLGEIDVVLPCNSENGMYIGFVSTWLYKSGLCMPPEVIVL